MVRLTIATNSNRKIVTTPVEATIEDILNANNVSVGGAALHLDGSIVAPDEYDLSLEDLGIEDETEVTLVAIVKADSAK